MKTLLLYAFSTNLLSYYDDWIEAFEEHSFFETKAINVLEKRKTDAISKDIEEYPLVILHHSMTADTLEFLRPFVGAFQQRKGRVVSFVGNEVNLPTVGMASKIKMLSEIAPDLILTQLLEETGKWLYEDCKAPKVRSLPHALNPKTFYPTSSQTDRPVDLGTRSAQYGKYIGDNERNAIRDFFLREADTLSLNVDVGQKKDAQARFDRGSWRDFLSQMKGMISTEAGSFYLEKDDQTVKEITDYIKDKEKKIVLPTGHPLLQKVGRLLTPEMKKKVRQLTKKFLTESYRIDESADFEDIYQKFFKNKKKCPFYSKAISSRHFDAIGTKTVNVMFEGRYNDILTPYEHYFPLDKKFKNIDELCELLKDDILRQKMVDRTYDYVMENHTHAHRLDVLRGFLES